MATLLSRLRWQVFARPQFGLRDLLLFTVASAVGVAALVNDWAHGLLVGVTGAIVVGLLIQAYDLAWAFRCQKELTPDERHGWQFAVFWRSSVFAIFVAQFMLALILPATAFETVFEGSLDVFVYYLLALSGVLDAPHVSVKSRSARVGSWFVSVGAWALAIVVALYVWKSTAYIMFLVHRANMGIVAKPSNLMREEWTPPVLLAQGRRFYLVSLMGALIAVMAVALLRVLAGRWHRQHWRLAISAAVIAAVAGSIGVAIWLWRVGMPAAAPFFEEMPLFYPWQVNCMAATILLILATGGAYRIVQPQELSLCSTTSWRRHASMYFHEWRTVSLLLIVAVVGQLVYFLRGYWGFLQVGWLRLIPELFHAGAMSPEGIMSIAVFLAAARVIFSARRRLLERADCGPRTLLMSRFFMVWLCLLLILASAAILFGTQFAHFEARFILPILTCALLR